MKYERGALVRGSDPPSGHSVHKRPVIRGGRLPGVPYKHLGAAVYKTGDKNLGPSPMAKKKTLFQVWEKSIGRCGQLLAP